MKQPKAGGTRVTRREAARATMRAGAGERPLVARPPKAPTASEGGRKRRGCRGCCQRRRAVWWRGHRRHHRHQGMQPARAVVVEAGKQPGRRCRGRQAAWPPRAIGRLACSANGSDDVAPPFPRAAGGLAPARHYRREGRRTAPSGRGGGGGCSGGVNGAHVPAHRGAALGVAGCGLTASDTGMDHAHEAIVKRKV